MTTQEKIDAILAAIESGVTSANKLEPSRRGATVAKMKSGRPVLPATVDRIYSSLQELLAGGDAVTVDNSIERKPITRHNAIERRSVTVDNDIERRLIALEAENAALRQAVDDLSARLEALAGGGTSDAPPDGIKKRTSLGNCLGFSLCQDKAGRYYGVRRIDGRLVSVYIGKDLSLAEQKLQAWLDRH